MYIPTLRKLIDLGIASSMLILFSTAAVAEPHAPQTPQPPAHQDEASSAKAKARAVDHLTEVQTQVDRYRRSALWLLSACSEGASTEVSSLSGCGRSERVLRHAEVELQRLEAHLRDVEGRFSGAGELSTEIGRRYRSVLDSTQRALAVLAAIEDPAAARSAVWNPMARATSEARSMAETRISGRVTDAQGAPVAGVIVHLYFDHEEVPYAAAVTDELGEYEVSAAAYGTSYLKVFGGNRYLDGLWGDVACDATVSCAPTDGSPLLLELGQETATADVVLSGGAIIGGRVVDDGSSDGLPNARVTLYDPAGDLVETAFTDAAGRYRFTGLPTGSYRATAELSGYATQLYDGMACGAGCDPTTGTPIDVALDGTAVVDFALALKGSVSGRVTSSQTAQPLAFVTVTIFDAAGQYVRHAAVDGQGEYRLGGLEAGTYYLRAHALIGYMTELYDDIACHQGACDVTTGVPVVVSEGAQIPDIDFDLELLGQIQLSVQRTVDGSPVEFAFATLYDEAGDFVDSLATFPDGTGAFFDLLGTHFMVIEADDIRLVPQLYDSMPYEFGTVDPTTGTPIPIGLADVFEADVALESWATIAGTVTDSADDSRLEGVEVGLYDDGGGLVASELTDDGGRYRFTGLSAGEYRVRIDSSPHYRPELWQGVTCDRTFECNLGNATPIDVTLDEEVQNIDFPLERLGRIEGRIVDSVTAEPLEGLDVRLRNDPFTTFRQVETNYDGRFVFDDLSTSDYRLWTRANGSHVDEVYDDVQCPPAGGCDWQAGALIPLAVGDPAVSLSITLDPVARITGQITDAASGFGLDAPGTVQAYTMDGTVLAAGYLDSDGLFEIRGLPAGELRVAAHFDGYRHEVWNDRPCSLDPVPICDLAGGDPVVTTAGHTVENINLALQAYGSISGTVTDSIEGGGIEVDVVLFDASGTELRTVESDENTGGYTLVGLSPGEYRVGARGFLHIDTIYASLPCELGCQVTEGTPVTVGLGEIVGGVDLDLDFGPGVRGRVTDELGAPLSGVAIDLRRVSDPELWLSTVTDGSGRYRLPLDTDDSYYLATDAGEPLVNQVHEDIPCPAGPAFLGLCAIEDGNAVQRSADGPAIVVDFELRQQQIFVDGFESGDVTAWSSSTP